MWRTGGRALSLRPNAAYLNCSATYRAAPLRTTLTPFANPPYASNYSALYRFTSSTVASSLPSFRTQSIRRNYTTESAQPRVTVLTSNEEADDEDDEFTPEEKEARALWSGDKSRSSPPPWHLPQGPFTYTGELDEQKRPHGEGKMEYEDGSIKEGTWQDGVLREGKITMAKLPNNKIALSDGQSLRFQAYSGQFSAKGKFSGHGRIEFGGNGCYEGSWKNGRYSGQGTLVSGMGTLYVGSFKRGEPYGQGRFTHKNGITEEGTWTGWMTSGTRKFPNGTSYTGDFDYNGDYSGKGHLIEVIPAKEGQPEQRTEQEGLFAAGWLVKGKARYADGTLYEGFMQRGKCHGQGVVTYPDGRTFAGEWRDGRFTQGIRTGKQ